MNREKTKDRAQIQQEYVDWYVNGLSITDMMRQIADEMHDDLDMLDDKELVKEVKCYAPEIVENLTLMIS